LGFNRSFQKIQAGIGYYYQQIPKYRLRPASIWLGLALTFEPKGYKITLKTFAVPGTQQWIVVLETP